MKEINEKYVYKKINYDHPLHKIYNSIFTRRNYAKYYYFKIILQKKLLQLLEFKKSMSRLLLLLVLAILIYILVFFINYIKKIRIGD